MTILVPWIVFGAGLWWMIWKAKKAKRQYLANKQAAEQTAKIATENLTRMREEEERQYKLALPR